MNISQCNYVSINEILADVLIYVDDEGQDKLTPGFYNRAIRQVLEDFNFSTYFNEVYFDIDFPANLRMQMPEGAWNIKDIFVYDKASSTDTSATSCSETSECCAITNMNRVWHKNNYITAGKNLGYTARNKAGNYNDPTTRALSSDASIYYYNIQNGIIMFSDSCKNFDKVRIVSNGLAGSNLNETKIVPPFIREAVVLAVSEKACMAIKGRGIEEQRYNKLWIDYKNQLYMAKTRVQSSIWDDALYRLKRKDSKEMKDLRTYLGKMNF